MEQNVKMEGHTDNLTLNQKMSVWHGLAEDVICVFRKYKS
jgi:hypothetical protein